MRNNPMRLLMGVEPTLMGYQALDHWTVSHHDGEA